MRLVDLDPQWLDRESGERVGLMLRCPHCVGTPRSVWLAVFFIPLPVHGEQLPAPEHWTGQFGPIRRALDRLKAAGVAPESPVVPVREGTVWTRSGDDLNTLTLSPSLDFSPSGDWHGFVRDGMIV